MIKRHWRGQRLALSQLPTSITNDDRYAYECEFSLDEALLSVDNRWIKLTFDCGTTHYWHCFADNHPSGGWEFSVEGPVWPDAADKPYQHEG